MDCMIFKNKYVKAAVYVALVGCSISGCAPPQELVFTPWKWDKAHWNLYELNGVQFSVPAELPRVQLRDELAFCFSAHKGDRYSPVALVPSQAVYVLCREGPKKKPDDIDDWIRTIESVKGGVTPVSKPISGYQYWRVGVFGNQDNSRVFRDTSVLDDMEWGYLFHVGDMKVCEVYVRKNCHVAYHDLDINQVITAEDRKLVEDIVSTIRSCK